MNPEKFTAKSIEALNGAQKIATSLGCATVDELHLLAALLESDGGVLITSRLCSITTTVFPPSVKR